ncbi:MAG: hypothetical protein LBR81_06215 [Prevotellaceae bacterium]|nr:hypothetical protein [Prevotellaceae bacterium]
MKNLIFILLLSPVAVFLTSCDGGGEFHHCGSSAVWCSKEKFCCDADAPWTDGFACWQTLNGCRQTGYACHICAPE